MYEAREDLLSHLWHWKMHCAWPETREFSLARLKLWLKVPLSSTFISLGLAMWPWSVTTQQQQQHLIYSDVQLDFTLGIEVFHMLFERWHAKKRMRSLK